MKETIHCLNLGCGDDIKKSSERCTWLNVDSFKVEGVDKIVDLNKFPYPFKDSSFDRIVCFGVLEYLDDVISPMKEIHRMLKPGGKAIIQVPYFNGPFGFQDILNKHFFTYRSFKVFEKKSNPHHNDRFKMLGFGFSKVKVNFVFGKKLAVWNYIIEPIANMFPSFYEHTPFKMFPAEHLMIEMRK